MFTSNPEPLSPEAQALLAEERKLAAAPDTLQRRALERAKRVVALSPFTGFHDAGNEFFRRPGSSLLWGAAGAGVIALAATTWLNFRDRAPTPVEPPTAKQASPRTVATPDSTTAAVAPATLGGASASRPASASFAPELPRGPEAGEGRRAELALVEATRRFVAARDYSSTLALVAEHEHRFARGVFIEEREAMRIKALWGLGRETQARAVVSTFRARFPQSILLPSLERLVRAVP